MTDPVLSFASILLGVVALHTAVLAVVLLRNRSNAAHASVVLGALAGVVTLVLVSMAMAFSEVAWPWPPLGALVGSFWFAVPPLFYAYVQTLFRERTAWRPDDLVHAIPFLTQLVAVAAWPLLPDDAGGPGVRFVFLTLYVLQGLCYAAVTVRLVHGYAKRYRREDGGALDDRVRSLQRYTLLFGAYALASLVNYVHYLAVGSIVLWLDFFVPLALAALISSIGYGLLRRTMGVLPELVLPDLPGARDPEGGGAPSPELVRHAEALRTLMATERPYLDPEVRLSTLAARVGVSERTLSQVLSSVLGATFYELVNGYRVDEAQARLRDPAMAHLTVLAIGLDAGFSSKASFNRVFKAQTGETPSAYRRRQGDAPVLEGASGDGSTQDETLSAPELGVSPSHRAG